MSLTPLPLPWLELSILVALAGALCVGPLRDAGRAWRLGLAFTAAAFACTLLAGLGFYLGGGEGGPSGSLQSLLLGREFLGVDELNAPLSACSTC
jgi:hypothetical protein